MPPNLDIHERPFLDDVIEPAELADALVRNHIRRRTHPTLPLSIYTYTEAAVYAQAWNTATRRCRGLIVDDDTGRIAAWPFEKFFNYSEHTGGKPYAEPLPEGEPFEVFDKIDGSLAVVFHYRGTWHVATKGSFESPQAAWAQGWLDRSNTAALYPSVTYLAEIVYPENRIVVKYDHDDFGLVLLGAYNHMGQELPLGFAEAAWWRIGGRSVKRYTTAESVHSLAHNAAEDRATDGTARNGTDAEGYVIRYASGLRVKIKFADYVRLHGVITRTSPRTVWEALAAGTPVSELLDTLPDEYRDWIRQTANRLIVARNTWDLNAYNAYAALEPLAGNRKDFAIAAQSSPYRAALFRILDGRSILDLSWQAVKPEHTDPVFHTDGSAAAVE